MELDMQHQFALVRFRMLVIFISIHDFLIQRVESMRIEFLRYWNIPDLVQQHQQRHDITDRSSHHSMPGDLTHLQATHRTFLSQLQSLCLLTKSTAPFSNEVLRLCHMGLDLRSMWPQRTEVGVTVGEQLTTLHARFNDHVKLLATLLSRSLSLSNQNDLKPLVDVFCSAASYGPLR